MDITFLTITQSFRYVIPLAKVKIIAFPGVILEVNRKVHKVWVYDDGELYTCEWVV